MSVVANMNGSNWFWGMRTVQSNDPAAWREGGGYGTGCNAPGWFNRGTCTATGSCPSDVPLHGSMVAAPVDPTIQPSPTCSPREVSDVIADGTFEAGPRGRYGRRRHPEFLTPNCERMWYRRRYGRAIPGTNWSWFGGAEAVERQRWDRPTMYRRPVGNADLPDVDGAVSSPFTDR